MAAPQAPEGARRPLVFFASTVGLIVAILTLPVVLAVGAPIEGWLLGLVLWLANWAGQLFTAKYAVQMSPTAAVGVAGLSFIGRAWLVFGALMVVAITVDRTVGLTAAGVFLVAFTFDLTGRAILHGLRQDEEQLTE